MLHLILPPRNGVCICLHLLSCSCSALMSSQCPQSHGNKAESSDAASASGSFANIYMNGSEVFKFAVRAVPTVRHIWPAWSCVSLHDDGPHIGLSSVGRKRVTCWLSAGR